MEYGTVFFLVRHGEAEQNVLRILDSFPGNPEFGLTEAGREQARKVGEELSCLGIDLLFASPMRRTRETAESIASAYGGIRIIFDERLRETDFGMWNGNPSEAFLGMSGKYHDPTIRLDGNAEESLEGFREIRSRLTAFLSDILVEHSGKRITIVSHGDPLEQLHGILVGDDVTEAATGWYPQKGSVTRIGVEAGFREIMIAREPLLHAESSDDMLAVQS
ncbi:MAG: histidine phosphatase family protein [Candidatus Moraniibacteriota bacterium]